ncbi:MAG: hypothetical protein OXC55_02515 [Chloroflexi bacterium]|nr:hypothetical protein [Chloroflexota bacterium]
MAKVTLVAFQDEPDRYMAYGVRLSKPVFRILDDELVKTEMRFPACLSFMQNATVGCRQRLDLDEVIERYGKPRSLYKLSRKQREP